MNMKSYKYSWTAEYYLLHLQFNNPAMVPFEAEITRNYANGTSRSEIEKANEAMDSHRILISRSHPKETDFTVEYPDTLVLEVYELDDRAYYPTKPIFKG